MSNSQTIDLAVVALYLIGVTIVGLIVGKKHSKSNEGYFLGDRQFNWVMIGMSLFATNISMGFFLGGTGKAYHAGFAALNPELLGGFMLTLSAIIFIPIYIRTRIATIPQFLELRFNGTAKLLYGGIEVTRSVIGGPLGMYMASLGILGLFGFEINTLTITLTSLVVACTVGLYATLGGLTSVVVTDMIQVGIMILAACLVTGVGLYHVGGFGALYAAAGAEQFTLTRPHDDPHFPWTAMASGQSLHSAFFAFCSIAILQRALGAKNVDHAQKGLLFAGFLKIFGIVLFVIPGIIASVLYPDIVPDTSYVVMIRDFLAPGLSGLVLAAMLAALMSSQDSGVNATASLVAMDLYPAISKKPNPSFALNLGKSVAAFIIASSVATAWLFQFTQQGLFDLVLSIAGFMILPVGVCYLFGRYIDRTNATGAVLTMALGLVLGVYYIVGKNFLPGILPFGIGGWHYYHVFPLFVAILSAVMLIGSFLAPPPPPEKLAFLKARADERDTSADGLPWYRKFYFWWGVYVCLFLALYLIF